MKTHSRVAIIQMRSDLEKSTNIKRAVAMITQAVDQGAECICLPETFNCLGTYPEMVDQAEAIPGRTINVLSDLASKHGIYIHCGSIFEPRRGKGRNNKYLMSLYHDPWLKRRTRKDCSSCSLDSSVTVKEMW